MASKDEEAKGKMVLTPQEVKALQECSSESFWYRCVPLSVVLIASTQAMVSKGILSPHPRYGALFKNMAAGLVAYVLGKTSYQGECRMKILALENSPLAEAMRQGKRGRDLVAEMSRPGGGIGAGVGSSSVTEAPGMAAPGAMRDEVGYLSPDADTNRRLSELDDNLRPTIDKDSDRTRSSDASSPYTSYDDLRRRNREEYEQKMAAAKSAPSRVPSQAPSYQPPPPSYQAPSYQPGQQAPSYQQPQPPPKRSRVNQYGDVIEE